MHIKLQPFVSWLVVATVQPIILNAANTCFFFQEQSFSCRRFACTRHQPAAQSLSLEPCLALCHLPEHEGKPLPQHTAGVRAAQGARPPSPPRPFYHTCFPFSQQEDQPPLPSITPLALQAASLRDLRLPCDAHGPRQRWAIRGLVPLGGICHTLLRLSTHTQAVGPACTNPQGVGG